MTTRVRVLVESGRHPVRVQRHHENGTEAGKLLKLGESESFDVWQGTVLTVEELPAADEEEQILAQAKEPLSVEQALTAHQVHGVNVD